MRPHTRDRISDGIATTLGIICALISLGTVVLFAIAVHVAFTRWAAK